jgi:tetratricopeptide (TPR) repeat protein
LLLAAAAMLMAAVSAASAETAAPTYAERCEAASHPDWAFGGEDTPLQYRPLFGCSERSGPRRDADQQFVEELKAKGFSDARLGEELIGMGWKWLGAGQLPAALNRFNLAFEYAPDNGEVYQGIAIVMANAGMPPRVAGYWFRQAVEAPEGRSGRFADYGQFLTMQGDYDAARPQLEKALEKEPGHAWAMMHLAHGYFEQGKVEAGCGMVERIAAAAPPPGGDEAHFRELVGHWRDRAAKAGCE